MDLDTLDKSKHRTNKSKQRTKTENGEQPPSPQKRHRTITTHEDVSEDEPQKRHKLSTTMTDTKGVRPTAAPLNSKDQPTQLDKREVPPSRKPAGNTLVIRQFVRPFQVKQVRELLEQTGTVTDFWMDVIRTHCFVSYQIVEQAIKTREALHNLIWPKHGTTKLQVDFISREDANKQIERAEHQSRTGSGAPHSKTVPGKFHLL